MGYLSPLTWADPTQTTLEAQVSAPVAGENPGKMGMHAGEAEIVRRLGVDPCYARQFAEASPEARGRIAFGLVAKALAAFERTLVSWSSLRPEPSRRAGAPAPRLGG